MTEPVAILRKVAKTYLMDSVSVPVIRGVDILVRPAHFTVLLGPSGSGKTTLLNLIAGLDRPSQGEVWVGDQQISALSEGRLARWRTRNVGFIFQFYHLLPELNVLENVLAPLMIRDSAFAYWKRRSEYRDRACEIIEKVGLSHRIKHKPSELSGGEMQRAAIARALVAKPAILLADEPTGNLDAQTGRGIMELLKKLNADEGLSIVMVTHDESIAAQAHRIVRLSNGRLQVMGDAA